MKVLILNGSPRKQKSVTGKLLMCIADGLRAGGAAIREFSLWGMKISPCSACFSCMHRTPGECATKDDMEDIYPHLKTSDILVIGTPVYVDGMSAQTKAVMDRSIACLQPFLTKDRSGRIRHPFNWRMPARFMLVSTCGFPEVETFGPLIAGFRAGAANFGAEPIAEVCVPGSIALQTEPGRLDGHLALLKALGETLARTDSIDKDVLAKVNTPPVSVEEYLKIAASYEAWCREHLAKGEENKR